MLLSITSCTQVLCQRHIVPWLVLQWDPNHGFPLFHVQRAANWAGHLRLHVCCCVVLATTSPFGNVSFPVGQSIPNWGPVLFQVARHPLALLVHATKRHAFQCLSFSCCSSVPAACTTSAPRFPQGTVDGAVHGVFNGLRQCCQYRSTYCLEVLFCFSVWCSVEECRVFQDGPV